MDDNNGAVLWERVEFTHPDDGVDFYIKLLRNHTGFRMLVLEPTDTDETYVTKLYDERQWPHDALLQDIDLLIQEHRPR